MSTTNPIITSTELLEIFIDDSNLWIEAQRMMAKVTGACKFDPRARVNIKELLNVLITRKLSTVTAHQHIKRVIGHSTIYGSQAKSLPPEAQGVWKHLSTRGFTVKAASRGNKLNREKGIDAQIASDITETIVGNYTTNSVLVLVAGDGDYTPLILKALKRNWKVEVWFWEHSHSKSLSPTNPLFRNFPSQFSFNALDGYLQDIAYLSWNWKGEICREKSIVLGNIPPNVSEETIERALYEVSTKYQIPDLIPHYERRIDHSRSVALVFPHIGGTPEALRLLYNALVSADNPTLSCCSISTYIDHERKMQHRTRSVSASSASSSSNSNSNSNSNSSSSSSSSTSSSVPNTTSRLFTHASALLDWPLPISSSSNVSLSFEHLQQHFDRSLQVSKPFTFTSPFNFGKFDQNAQEAAVGLSLLELSQESESSPFSSPRDLIHSTDDELIQQTKSESEDEGTSMIEYPPLPLHKTSSGTTIFV